MSTKEVRLVLEREVKKISETHDVGIVDIQESFSGKKLNFYFHLNDLRFAPEEFNSDLEELVNSIGLTYFEWHDEKVNVCTFIY